MALLPLESTLYEALPWLSPFGKAVIKVMACDNGRTKSASALAARLGLRNRYQLARLLRREGLPPYDRLTGWAAVLYWMLEADRTGAPLLALAHRSHLDPAASYRLVRRVTGTRWSELRRVGANAALRHFLSLCHRGSRHDEAGGRRGAPLGFVRKRDPQIARDPTGAEPGAAWPRGSGPRLSLRLPLDGAPFAVAVRDAREAYVTRLHAAAVERLDLATGRFVGTIPVGCVPTRVTFDATGTRAYVSIQYGEYIAVIDATTHAPIATLPVPGDPFPVQLGRNGEIVYSTTNENRLYAVSLRTGRIVARVPLPATSHNLALHPTGERLYVATRAAGTVLEIETARHRVTRTFTLGGLTQGLTVSRDGRALYVTNEDHGLDVVCLATGQRIASLNVGGGALELALTPDEREIYVAIVSAGAVAVVDRASLTLRTILPTGGRPRGMAFDRTGRVLVVANEAGWVDLVPAGLATAGACPPLAPPAALAARTA